MPLTEKQRDLLAALDDNEWRMVNYRLGPFNRWMAHELVRRIHLGAGGEGVGRAA